MLNSCLIITLSRSDTLWHFYSVILYCFFSVFSRQDCLSSFSRVGGMSLGNDIPISRVGCSISVTAHTHTHSPHTPRYTLPNVVREWWGTVLPTEKSCLFHLRQITISLGLDSNGLSLWNGIPAHALQIYLLFYLPGQAHGKIIPNTCRALSGTLE